MSQEMEVDLELGSEVGSNVQMRRECFQNLNNFKRQKCFEKNSVNTGNNDSWIWKKAMILLVVSVMFLNFLLCRELDNF